MGIIEDYNVKGGSRKVSKEKVERSSKLFDKLATTCADAQDSGATPAEVFAALTLLNAYVVLAATGPDVQAGRNYLQKLCDLASEDLEVLIREKK